MAGAEGEGEGLGVRDRGGRGFVLEERWEACSRPLRDELCVTHTHTLDILYQHGDSAVYSNHEGWLGGWE